MAQLVKESQPRVRLQQPAFGEAYCVSDAGPAATTVSGLARANVAPLAPTPPGTTARCFQWHVVVSGDICSAVEASFCITTAQFVQWNQI
jgi:hypothetical protein